MKMCPACDIIQSPQFTNDELIFTCELCHISTPSNNEDSLRKERVKESDIMIHENILNKAIYDPATKKARINCENRKCHGDIVKQVVVGEEMYLYNICVLCKFIWRHN